MGPTWVLSVPDGPHVGPMDLAIRGVAQFSNLNFYYAWTLAVWFITLSPKHSGKYHNRPLSCDHSSCSSCSAIFPDTSSAILNDVICWSICALCIYLFGGLVINSQFLKWPSMFCRVATQEQRTIASLKSPWRLWAIPKCVLPKQIMGKWLLHAYWDYSVPTKKWVRS